MQTKHQKLIEEYPFLTVIAYAGNEYLGIIQNIDNHVASLYVYDRLTDTQERIKFLELGDVWWWESNRQIPIHLFLKDEWSMFRPFLKTFNNKALNMLHGPTVSMSDFQKKRVKRKTITLVKKVY